MECEICNIELSNQSSFNRHISSNKHEHNVKNPYHTFANTLGDVPVDIINLIWDFVYIKTRNPETGISHTLFEFLEDGYNWKAYDIIFNRKMKPIEYISANRFSDNQKQQDDKRYIRDISVVDDPKHYYRQITFRAINSDIYNYSTGVLEVPIFDIDYVWKKIKDLKDRAVKSWSFDSHSTGNFTMDVLS